MAKPRLLLLDADIVITAHSLGIWEQLKAAYEIAVPATIVREARYFQSVRGSGSIGLQAEIDRNEIRCLEGTADELIATFKNFETSFLQGIDAGEREAISLISSGRCNGYVFCTGDTIAMNAIGMLDLGGSSMSFETVLRSAKIDIRLRASCPTRPTRATLKRGEHGA